MELWEPIKNYENLYEVSNLGKVRSKDRIVEQRAKSNSTSIHVYKGRILKPKNRNGYLCVDLCKNGKKHCENIHRLVAEAFCDNPNNYKYVDHKNGYKRDNRANNLRWVTQSENVRYANIRQSIINPKCKTPHIINIETNKRFNTSRDAAEWLKCELNLENSPDANIRRSCRSGGVKPVHTYHFKYI